MGQTFSYLQLQDTWLWMGYCFIANGLFVSLCFSCFYSVTSESTVCKRKEKTLLPKSWHGLGWGAKERFQDRGLCLQDKGWCRQEPCCAGLVCDPGMLLWVPSREREGMLAGAEGSLCSAGFGGGML